MQLNKGKDLYRQQIEEEVATNARASHVLKISKKM
jgi:hypothetical protein